MTEAILVWMASVLIVLALVLGLTEVINSKSDWMDSDD